MAIALVQHTISTTASAVSSRAATFGSNVAAGDLLICVIGWSISAGAPTLTSVTDTRGNTWSVSVQTPDQSGGRQIAIAWAVANGAGACTVTATLSGASAQGMTVHISEFSGTSGSPTDQTNLNTGNSTTADSGNITPGANGCLLIGAEIRGTDAGKTANNGFTILDHEATLSTMSAYLIQGTAAATSANFTLPSSVQWGCCVADFLPSGAVLSTFSEPAAILTRPLAWRPGSKQPAALRSALTLTVDDVTGTNAPVVPAVYGLLPLPMFRRRVVAGPGL